MDGIDGELFPGAVGRNLSEPADDPVKLLLGYGVLVNVPTVPLQSLLDQHPATNPEARVIRLGFGLQRGDFLRPRGRRAWNSPFTACPYLTAGHGPEFVTQQVDAFREVYQLAHERPVALRARLLAAGQQNVP